MGASGGGNRRRATSGPFQQFRAMISGKVGLPVFRQIMLQNKRALRRAIYKLLALGRGGSCRWGAMAAMNAFSMADSKKKRPPGRPGRRSPVGAGGPIFSPSSTRQILQQPPARGGRTSRSRIAPRSITGCLRATGAGQDHDHSP